MKGKPHAFKITYISVLLYKKKINTKTEMRNQRKNIVLNNNK